MKHLLFCLLSSLAVTSSLVSHALAEEEEVVVPIGSKPIAIDHPQNGFAGCLLMMDENYRLVEWLAYHYHVLPLRRLIVAVDPRSKASPTSVLERWKDKMSIELWGDEDIFSKDDLANRTLESGLLALHRSRQRAFNVKCMKRLREEGSSWTIMTDTDEYAYVNPRAHDPSDPLHDLYRGPNVPPIQPVSIETPGSVLKQLIDMTAYFSTRMPCIPLPRLQFGNIESSQEEVVNEFPADELYPALQASDFDTFLWRHFGVDTVTARNGVIPGKTLIDLSRVSTEDDHLLVGDPHRPIDKLCNPRNVWLEEHESLFVANHVLGTLEQFAARDDSRLLDRILNYESKKNVQGYISDEVRGWLKGFVKNVGQAEAHRLLAGVGRAGQMPTSVPPCSINFFGLPRSFKTMVLPSLVQNVLLPNAEYNCDIVVHYYNIYNEEEGRFNDGGEIDADSVHLLEEITRVVAAHKGKEPPNIVIRGETKQEFNEKFGQVVKKFQTETDLGTGKPKYFPWADESYTPREIENIVMQWHSIRAAWDEMMSLSSRLGVKYERVAFLRVDAFYASPVDIYELSKDIYDFSNRNAIVPPFAKYPVSDRMIYGPYDAVKIWATERFSRLEHYISTFKQVGYGIHPERFLAYEIFPAIQDETGVQVTENKDICFYRTRAGDTALISDCTDVKGGVTSGFDQVNAKQLVEKLVGHECYEVPLDAAGRFMSLRCDDSTVLVNNHRQLSGTVAPKPKPTPHRGKRGKRRSW